MDSPGLLVDDCLSASDTGPGIGVFAVVVVSVDLYISASVADLYMFGTGDSSVYIEE